MEGNGLEGSVFRTAAMGAALAAAPYPASDAHHDQQPSHFAHALRLVLADTAAVRPRAGVIDGWGWDEVQGTARPAVAPYQDWGTQPPSGTTAGPRLWAKP